MNVSLLRFKKLIQLFAQNGEKKKKEFLYFVSLFFFFSFSQRTE